MGEDMVKGVSRRALRRDYDQSIEHARSMSGEIGKRAQEAPAFDDLTQEQLERIADEHVRYRNEMDEIGRMIRGE